MAVGNYDGHGHHHQMSELSHVERDLEFCFKNGQAFCVSVDERSGSIAQDDGTIVIQRHLEDGSFEEITVECDAVAYSRTVTRVVKPDQP